MNFFIYTSFNCKYNQRFKNGTDIFKQIVFKIQITLVFYFDFHTIPQVVKSNHELQAPRLCLDYRTISQVIK